MRIHINQGNQTFKEEFFYPMPGATRIIARDFDQDGDTDIALLSTFPDYQAQESPFIYLENKNSKDYVFEPYTFDALGTARWFLMEAGDMDGDGDTDLVLSAFSLSFNKAPQDLVKRWEDNDTDILFLMNNLIKNPE
jgi:hypothetical protein